MILEMIQNLRKLKMKSQSTFINLNTLTSQKE